MRFASQSLEHVWKETEGRLPLAIDACVDRTVLARPDMIRILKNAIVLHHVRNVHIRQLLDVLWDIQIRQIRKSFLATRRTMTEREFRREYRGLVPAGDAGLNAVIDDALA